jgi:DNA polymerase III alpha subunit (gram-positive type)
MNIAEVTLPVNVTHFLDTLALMKSLYPDRKSYHLADLVADLLGSGYGAHDASEDSRILQDLVGLAMEDREPVTLRTVVGKHLMLRADVLRSALKEERPIEDKLKNLHL